MRNAPHRIEILDADLIDIIDGTPLHSHAVRETVSGWFTFLDAEERETWREQGVEASVRLPVGVEITQEDRVRLVGAPPGLIGEWRIRTIRRTPQHQRLMVTRAS